MYKIMWLKTTLYAGELFFYFCQASLEHYRHNEIGVKLMKHNSFISEL